MDVTTIHLLRLGNLVHDAQVDKALHMANYGVTASQSTREGIQHAAYLRGVLDALNCLELTEQDLIDLRASLGCECRGTKKRKEGVSNA